MSYIKKFNPYDLPEETLQAIATGRERVLERILATIVRNAEGGTVQHLQVVAPRGYGKSFLMRLVQSALKVCAVEGLPVALALLPEEQHNVDAPHRLLNEIQRVLDGRPADSLLGGAFAENDAVWDPAVATLDASIAARLPEGRGIVVAMIENFDQLMVEVFRKPQDQSRLRALLARPGGRLMLLATATRRADAAYEQRLFHATGLIELDPWQEESCLAFFERLRGHRQAEPMPPKTRAKAQAIAQFIGGSPRMATVLAQVLDSNDSLQAAAILDALVDELTPYYKHRIESLSRRARTLLDALLRMGEPRTQSEIAARLGTTQARIAEPFNELRARGEVVGVKAQRSAEMLYRVGDRLMAHYYRKRHLTPGEGASLLEGITELLAGFFSPEEKRVEAERLRALGRAADAAVLERLVATDLAPASIGQPNSALNGGWLDQLRDRMVQLFEAGQVTEAVALTHQAVKRAASSDDLREQMRSLRYFGWSLGQIGRHAEAVDTFGRAIALAEQAGDVGEQAAASRHLGWLLSKMERYAEAEDTLRRAIALAEQAGEIREQAAASGHLGWLLSKMERHAKAEDTLRCAIALAEQAGEIREQAASSRHLGWLLSHMERHSEAEETLRRAIALAEQADEIREQVVASRHLGWLLNQMDRHAEAEETLRRAIALSEQAGKIREQSESLRHLGWSLGQMERYPEAEDTLRRALALAEQVGELRDQLEASRLLGWLLNQMGRHADAMDTLRRAIVLAGQTGDTSDLSRAEISLLIVAQEIGDDATVVMAWQRAVAVAPLTDIPSIATWFDDAAAAALRSGQFSTVWHTAAALSVLGGEWWSLDSAQHKLADTVAEASRTQGRAAAYALSAQCVEVLAQGAAAQATRDSQVGPDPISFLRGVVAKVAEQVTDPALLRDIAALLERHLPSDTAAERALLDAAARRVERPDDPAALERVNPDIATALDRLLGVGPKPPSKTPQRRSKRNGAPRRKK
ncbi:tetratricopeptide repeat protein [Archangium gephyra]|uniref:tetratricopeptide repeat protein n=1 Tax=Archangium gephyra TaxID=48 RepID=UPI0035D49460